MLANVGGLCHNGYITKGKNMALIDELPYERKLPRYRGDMLPEWRKEQIKKVVAEYYAMKEKEGK